MTQSEQALCTAIDQTPNLTGYHLLVKMIALRTYGEAGGNYDINDHQTFRVVEDSLIGADKKGDSDISRFFERFERLLRKKLNLP